MKLWGGRFTEQPNIKAWEFNASIGFDQRLAKQDIRASIAWAKALARANVLTDIEQQNICNSLTQIEEEFEKATFQIIASDEDIHTAVERRLFELIGSDAGKLHTGRSRNDQVSTDFRMWLMEQIQQIDQALEGVQKVMITRAEKDIGIIMPGYTHLQRAMPILISHWWLSHFWPLQRDRQRLFQLYQRTAYLPLGSAALAGTTIPVDRRMLSAELGFQQPAPNSIDAVSDRDFAVEFLFCSALIGIHMSKLSEAVILYTSREFNFFKLGDAFTTGSSLMPQKKNPDLFELVRGKSGTLLGYLTGLMATLKGLPSTYDKDLQEDKVPVFNAVDTLLALLPLVGDAVDGLKLKPEVMLAAIDPSMMATNLADYLVGKGIPFRQAHHLIGEVVLMANNRGVGLTELRTKDYQKISELFESDLYALLDPKISVERHNVFGGTSTQAVEHQIKHAKEEIISITYNNQETKGEKS
ncbi:MAG: argininosuccinate lyase [Chloroflexi bacterium]|nr:argininosuccinate lyase [Chloroflexota bacterium]